MSAIRFEATPLNIGGWTILRLPESASAQLPSRGMALVQGTLNGVPATIVLEPDGKGSHWFRVEAGLQAAAGIDLGAPVRLAVEPSKDWPEPEVPQDLGQALASDPQASALWLQITPLARWDWLRWVRSTHQPETRQRRIQVALSKLRAGERRPCCFNRNMCSEPQVSKNGVLVELEQPTIERQAAHGESS